MRPLPESVRNHVLHEKPRRLWFLARTVVSRAGVAALVLGLTGCTATPAPTELPPGLSAEFAQLRSDVAARQAQVRFVNDTDGVLVVGELRVEDPRFDGAATRLNERESTVPAGGTVDVRVQLPPMACPGEDAAESSLVVQYTLGDEAAEVTVPLSEPIPFLTAMHERECLVAALAEVAGLEFTAFTPSPPGSPAELMLEVTPTGTGDAEITGIQATNLLRFDGSAETLPLDVVVASSTRALTVPIRLVPLRCDPHAVQEDKRGTIFTIEIVLDGEPGEIELAASPEQRGEILSWVADWCGFGQA